MTETKETVSCLECNKILRTGRPDRKFCNDACRHAYNNRIMQLERAEIKSIDLILKHNRRILKQCLGGEKSKKLSREQLLQLGFQFDFHTHFYQNHKQEQYVFCYDYGYLELRGDICLVVKSR